MPFAMPAPRLRRFQRWLRRGASAALIAAALHPGAARAQALDPDPWIPDGPVHALAASGSAVYLGGAFSRMYPVVGAAARLDPGTGAAAVPYAWVIGSVHAAVSDGAGGWYLGGAFTEVRGQARANLAHVDAAGQVTAWNPGANDTVRALAITGNDVLVGGRFTTLAGQPRVGLGAVGRATGAATAWNPGLLGGDPAVAPPPVEARSASLGCDPPTCSITATGTQVQGPGTVQLCGPDTNSLNYLWSTGATTRCIDVGVGTYALTITDWITGCTSTNPCEITVTPCNQPCTIDAPDTEIYGDETASLCGPAGNFSYLWSTGATTRCIQVGPGTYGLEVTDLVSGCTSTASCEVTVSAVVPPAFADVFALEVDGPVVVVGGRFSHVGLRHTPNAAVIAIEAGVVTSFRPATNGVVRAIVVHENTVFLGGDFTTVGGQPRPYLAAVSRNAGVLDPWDPGADGPVTALRLAQRLTAPQAGRITVYAAGRFTQLGGQPRPGLGAVDGVNASATAFAPAGEPGGPGVNTLELRLNATTGDPDAIYAGGEFSSLGGQPRARIAELDPTGAATAWDPGADGAVEFLRLAPGGGSLFVGGSFVGIGGVPRRNLASLNRTTGALRSWNPGADGEVRALAVQGTTVYLGGAFASVGGQPRIGLAAVEGTSGSVRPFQPDPLAAPANGVINALAVRNGIVYAGGVFTSIGGAARDHLAAVDGLSGLATAWNPGADGAVHALATTQQAGPPNGVRVYAGGEFCSIGGAARCRLAELDGATALATAFDPAADGVVRSLALETDGLTGEVTTLYAGGEFGFLGGQARARLGAVDPAGVATAWNPQADATVRALALRNAAPVAAGDFANAGGAARSRVAELDAGSGAATDWAPAPDASVRALLWTGDAMYVGGDFATVLGRPRPHFARLSEALVAVDDPRVVPMPGGIALAAAPNPSTDDGDVVVACALPEAAVRADVTIHDLAGRLVRRLHAGRLAAGTTRFAWDGRDDGGERVTAGVYFVRVRDQDRSGVAKIVRI